MATIRDIELVYDEMLLKKLNFYKVFDSDGKSLLTSQTDKEVTPPEAVKSLRQFLDKLDGIINLHLSNKSGEEIGAGGNVKNTSVFKYQIKLGDPAIQSRQGINGPETSSAFQTAVNKMQETFDAKLEALEEKYKHKSEMDELRREIKDIKEGESLQKEGIGLLKEMLNTNTPQKNTMHAPAIAGIDDKQKIERLRAAIKQISSVDPDYVEHLEMLANIAINSPAVYQEALKKLQSF